MYICVYYILFGINKCFKWINLFMSEYLGIVEENLKDVEIILMVNIVWWTQNPFGF